MRLSAIEAFPVPDGVSSQHDRTDRNHDDRGEDRTAKGAVQRFIIRNNGKSVEHTVKNDSRHQAFPFVKKDDQRKPDEHGEDDLADGIHEILAAQQVDNMPDAEGD